MKVLAAIGALAIIGAVSIWLLAEDAIAMYEEDDCR